MPEMHLRQPRFTYSACGSFTKTKQRMKNIKETGDSRYSYQNELDKACFQLDTAYGEFKDVNRRTFADKVLLKKVFNIAKDPKYDGYQRGLASMVYKVFDNKPSGSGIKKESFSNKELLENLIKKVHSTFIDNI